MKVMKNEMVYVNQKEVWKMKRKIYANDDTFCVEIDGRKCSHLADYFIEISNKFQFPTIAKGFDVYDDWITDLTWINQDKIVVIINNYTDFLRCDLLSKKKVLELFEQSILPWWDTEVCNCVVGGIPKSFTVYLVD